MFYIFALVLHFIFLASVFDIYFKSPILKSDDISQHAPDFVPPARRLFLFVGDGLRAQSFFDVSEESRAPFLRHVIENRGAWGVSHTRVPTESRPGHVALIAGMYEDPSAITKGWKDNPVDFDTVFNQSRRTFSWGSPDILPMFAKGAAGGHVLIDTYDEGDENFDSDSPSALDDWVLEKVKAFFDNAKENHTLQMKLREDKQVFFLHLLASDVLGHTKKPDSRQYKRNIANVDRIIETVEGMAEEYWRKDGRTAYVFTADHGMTDWGSHGAGLEVETWTPLVAWGAGVRKPVQSNGSKESPVEWDLWDFKRTDVAQADVAPLMSSLIGVNMPMNSVGRLPLDYLDMHPDHRAKAMLANALGIYEQFKINRKRHASVFLPWLFHRPFARLTPEIFDGIMTKISTHLRTGYHDRALKLCHELFDLSLEGFEYYRTYQRRPLYIAIASSYVGFISLLLLKLTRNFSVITTACAPSRRATSGLALTCFTLLGLSVFSVLAQSLPLHFIIYFSTPIIVWTFVVKEAISMKTIPFQSTDLRRFFLTIIVSLVILELLIQTFMDRRLLSLAICGMMTWQLFEHRSTSRIVRLAWFILCMGLAAFSFQPAISNDANPNLVLVAGLISASGGLLANLALNRSRKLEFASVIGLCCFCVLASVGVWLTNLSGKLSLHVQAATWTIFFLSIPLSLLSETKMHSRLLSVYIALQSMYLLLCLSYEGLFLLCLSTTLIIWIVMEYTDGFNHQDLLSVSFKPVRERNIMSVRDIQRSLFFLFFSMVAFFGTGNVASINSFNPSSIRCFVAVFSPFLMGGLLLFKVVIPFINVAVAMVTVKQLSNIHTDCLVMLVLLFSDVMGLHFFFFVTDTGSWLDIGTSLSHFIIAMATVIFLQILLFLAKFLVQTSLYSTKASAELKLLLNK